MPWLKKPEKKARPKRWREEGERKRIAAKLYNKTAWRNLRASTVARMPYCVVCLCLKDGARITMAEEVHHLTPIMSGMDDDQRASLAYAVDNVAPLCRRCHRLIHERGLRGVDEERLWSLLDALHTGADNETLSRMTAELITGSNGEKDIQDP